MRKARLWLCGTTVVALATAVALASAASGAYGNSGNSRAAKKSPIKIGTILPLSGEGSQYPEVLAGARAAVRGVNTAGGIDGHPLQLVWCDDQNDVNQGEACARKMVSEGVVVMAGGYGDFGAQELPILNTKHIPEFGEEVQDSSLEYNAPTEFDLDPGALGTFATGAVYGTQVLHDKTFSLTGQDFPVVVAIAKTAQKSVQIVGGKWEGFNAIPATATDMDPYVAAAASSKSQLVLAAMGNTTFIQFALAAEQSGYSFTTLYPGVANTIAEYKQMGPNTPFGRHLLFASPVPPKSATAEFPTLKIFNKNIAAEYKSGDSQASPGNYSISQEQEWYAIYALSKIMNLIPTSTINAASITKELNKAKDVNFGLQPPWTSPTIDKGPKGYTRVNTFYQYLLKLTPTGQLALAYPKPVNVKKALGL